MDATSQSILSIYGTFLLSNATIVCFSQDSTFGPILLFRPYVYSLFLFCTAFLKQILYENIEVILGHLPDWVRDTTWWIQIYFDWWLTWSKPYHIFRIWLKFRTERRALYFSFLSKRNIILGFNSINVYRELC